MILDARQFFSRRKRLAALIWVLASLSFFWVGCGRKGPPSAPRRPLPPVVKDLAYTLHNDTVELSWTVVCKDDRSASPAATVKVFRSRLPLEEAGCENCPIRYSVAGDIPIQMERSQKGQGVKMSYAELLEPGYRYYYKVICYGEYGIGGQDSNVVQFDH